MSCVGGYCRCNNDRQCGEGLTCTDPLAGTAGSGRVCRATHPNVEPFKPGVRVLRERLDRWVSSRPMWNQHAYSVTNIGGDGKVPKTSEWTQNFTVPTLNNYRAQVQGSTGFGDFPDITGALNADNVCAVSDGQITLTASVCNRGTKAVGAAMPATFYNGEPSTTNILCVSFTAGPVPVGGCMPVSCTFTGTDVTGVVTMVVNDNGGAGQTTVECDPDNNVDSVTIAKCDVVR
jgi:hypothetical protein